MIFSPVFPQKLSLQCRNALLSLKIFFLLLLVSFVTVCFSVCYILRFGFLARVCVVWARLVSLLLFFFWGGGCWLPVTPFPSIYLTPTGSLHLIHSPPLLAPNKPPKSLKILGRLSAIWGGRVCGFVSVCVAGAVQDTSIPSLNITHQFIPQPIHYSPLNITPPHVLLSSLSPNSAIHPLTQQFICSRTCVLL